MVVSAARALADVNVLLALLWPPHRHHRAAQAWFAAEGHKRWATNAITQLGVIRLLTNPAITRGMVDGVGAVAAIEQATQHSGHEFWPLQKPVSAALAVSAPNVTGHRQWTDLLLLDQARERGGRLITFDTGLNKLAGRDAAQLILLLK